MSGGCPAQRNIWRCPKSRHCRDSGARFPFRAAPNLIKPLRAAETAFWKWRRTPATERVQYLFKLKNLMEDSFEDLSRAVTIECGKTLDEARGEIRRGH